MKKTSREQMVKGLMRESSVQLSGLLSFRPRVYRGYDVRFGLKRPLWQIETAHIARYAVMRYCHEEKRRGEYVTFVGVPGRVPRKYAARMMAKARHEEISVERIY